MLLIKQVYRKPFKAKETIKMKSKMIDYIEDTETEEIIEDLPIEEENKKGPHIAS